MENYKIIRADVLETNDRWLINSFLSDNKNQDLFVGSTLIELGEILKERKETCNPQDTPFDLVNYLGLENVQSFTGYLIDFSPRLGKEIKSRCKVFYTKDILFGRLRPTLNKSILIDETIQKGICSTEFLVFEINTNLISPQVIRYLIASKFVQDQIENYVAGAALPRIQVSDFLSIKIPLLEGKLEMELSQYLSKITNEYKEYYSKLIMFETNLNNSLMETIEKQELVKI